MNTNTSPATIQERTYLSYERRCGPVFVIAERSMGGPRRFVSARDPDKRCFLTHAAAFTSRTAAEGFLILNPQPNVVVVQE